MYALPTYTMNGNIDQSNQQKLLDDLLYHESNTKLLKDMLAHNANPNIENSYGNTPLHFAALHRSPQCLAILLDAGALPNKQNSYRVTPLHYAVGERQYNSIQLLLKAKADPNLVNKDKDTPLYKAITTHVDIPTVKLLLCANTNPNWQDIEGQTLLHSVVRWSHVAKMVKFAQLLLQYGAQVDIVDNKHNTPLQLLAPKKYSPIARKMGRLLVWYHYILLPHFAKVVPKEIAHIVASHVALLCAKYPIIWS